MRFACAAVVGLIGLAGGGGCTYSVEKGFRYEYAGRVLRADGVTPVKGATVYLGRPDAPPPPTDLPPERMKDAGNYVDKANKDSTDKAGGYVGALETVKGWRYGETVGFGYGPQRAPEPPRLDEVIVYVQEKGGSWVGYRLAVPPEAQAEARSGVRKLNVPDLLIPDPPATKPAKK